MKRYIISAIVVVVFISLLSLPVIASDDEYTASSIPHDFSEEAVAVRIVDFINSISGGVPRNVSINEIDFSRVYKFYVGIDIFTYDVNSFHHIVQILEQESAIVFELPVYMENGDVYVANISRRLPMDESARTVFTDAQIEEYEQTVGEWVVTAMSVYTANDIPFVDYYENLRGSINATGSYPIFVGSLPYFMDPVALFPDVDGNIGRLVPLNPYPNHWNSLYGYFADEMLRNGWVDYVEVKDYIRANPLNMNASGLSGGGDFGEPSSSASDSEYFPWWIPAIAVIALFGVTAICIVKLKQ